MSADYCPRVRLAFNYFKVHLPSFIV